MCVYVYVCIFAFILHLGMQGEFTEDTEYQHKLNIVTEQCFRSDIHKLVLLSLSRVCTISVFCLFTVNQNMKFGEVRGDF